MTKWNHIEKELPEKIERKKVIGYCKEIDNLIWVEEDQLRNSKRTRDFARIDLLEAKPVLLRMFAVFHKWIERGCGESKKDKKKKKLIVKSFISMKEILNQLETGSQSRGRASIGDTPGMMKDDVKFPMIVRFKTAIERIFKEVMVDNMREAAKESNNKEEFYDSLFEKVYEWAGLEIYNLYQERKKKEKKKSDEKEAEEIEETLEGTKEEEKLGWIT